MDEIPVRLRATVEAAGTTAYAADVPLDTSSPGPRAKWAASALTLLVLLGAGSASAQESITKQGNIAFISGGIGVDSEERLKALEKDFTLKLVFTLVEGNYVSDVNVSIKDASGKTVLQSIADGPFLMAKLPAGTYTVTAAYNGQQQARKVVVTANRLRTEYIRWKSDPNTDFPLPREAYKE